ncbi:MAG: monovalent cation/H+ antiporter complex subunit F [Bdellovibrio sp.]
MNPLYALLIISTFLAVIRFIKGPEWADRIMIFDLLTSIIIAAAMIAAIETNEPAILSFVLLLSFLAFTSTLAVVYYLERIRKD